MLKDEMNGRDRAARLEEWSHSGAGIRMTPQMTPAGGQYKLPGKSSFNVRSVCPVLGYSCTVTEEEYTPPR